MAIFKDVSEDLLARPISVGEHGPCVLHKFTTFVEQERLNFQGRGSTLFFGCLSVALPFDWRRPAHGVKAISHEHHLRSRNNSNFRVVSCPWGVGVRWVDAILSKIDGGSLVICRIWWGVRRMPERILVITCLPSITYV